MSGYFEYYNRAIQQHSNGLKLVLGGTGLGKTRGIRLLIRQSQSVDSNRKFIYVANRIQLLNEMYRDLKKDGLSSDAIIHLERNRDTVKNALSSTSKRKFYKLLYSKTIQQIANRHKLDIIAIEKISLQIENLITLIDNKQVSVINHICVIHKDRFNY